MGQTTVYVGGKADHVYDSGTGTSSPVPNNASQATQAADAATASAQVGAEITAGTLPAGSPAPLYTPPATLTAANTKPTSGINLPSPTPTGNLGTSTMTQLTGIAASAKALQDSLNAQTKTDGSSTADTDFQTYLKSLTAPTKTADIYQQAETDTGVQAKQQEVNGYTAQLAAITAKANADKLSLTGTGRGIPEAIIGGQQAEIDKEAAIQSLPIAAQLAASQADLKLAQDHLDTLFKLRSEDATNAANYQNKLVDAVYNFANEKQKTQLEAMKTKTAQDFSLMTNNLNYAQSLATEAIHNGQPGIAAQLMKLDHTDPNYAANIAVLAKGITVAPKGNSVSISDQKTEALSTLSDFVQTNNNGQPLSYGPVVDANGNITPAALKQMLAAAPRMKLTASEVLTSVAPNLYAPGGIVDPRYGLNAAELKLVNAGS